MSTFMKDIHMYAIYVSLLPKVYKKPMKIDFFTYITDRGNV